MNRCVLEVATVPLRSRRRQPAREHARDPVRASKNNITEASGDGWREWKRFSSQAYVQQLALPHHRDRNRRNATSAGTHSLTSQWQERRRAAWTLEGDQRHPSWGSVGHPVHNAVRPIGGPRSRSKEDSHGTSIRPPYASTVGFDRYFRCSTRRGWRKPRAVQTIRLPISNANGENSNRLHRGCGIFRV